MAKRIREVIPFIIIWISAVLLGTAIYLLVNMETPEYTGENPGIVGEEYAYIADNYGTGGVIWKTDLKGKRIGMFSSKKSRILDGWNITQMDSVDENIYVVFERRINDAGRMVNQYCVALMNEAFDINYLTPVFRFPLELNLTGFQATEDTLYLTALSDNGQQAYVYSLKTASMITMSGELDEDTEKWKESKTTLVIYDTRESVWPRFFTDAEYRDGDIILRYDDSDPGYFAKDSVAEDIYKKAVNSPREVISASGFNTIVPLMVALIGVLLIIAVWMLLFNRRRVVYAVFIFETILLVLVCGITFFVSGFDRKSSEEEFIRFAVADAQSVFDGYSMVNLSSDEIYDRDEYGALSDRLSRRVGTDGAGTNIKDMLVVDALSGNVVLSASGKNKESISNIYGRKIANLLVNIGNGDEYVYEKVRLKGKTLSVLLTSLNSSGHQAYSIVTIAEADSIYHGFFAKFGNCLKFIGVLFVIGSIAGLIFFSLQSRDIRKLQDALGRLARGEEEVDKGLIIGRDMNFMWNSLMEIRKNIVNTNRIKFLTYEAYFRFAPKSIERILKKQSITEIKCGDIITANGVLANLLIPGKNESGRSEVSRKSELLGVSEECRENYDGILISHNDELSNMKYLFEGENKLSVEFGVELMQKLREDKGRGFNRASMILHYAPYIYGVAGDEKQAAVYFSSDEAEKLWAYADWFRSLRLALIITGELIEREGGNGDYRYIGFIVPDKNNPDRRIRLYEALDAEIPAVRARRVRQKARFAEALDLFYKKDFYIARGVFSEILRESPDDELTKWYLFECEKYLEGVLEQDFVGELHMD